MTDQDRDVLDLTEGRTLLDRVSNEQSRKSMSNRLMNPELYAGLDLLAIGAEEHLDEVMSRDLPHDMTVTEMEDNMRQEVLTARLIGDDFEKLEVDICEKYAKYAQSTFMPERGEFRIEPFQGFGMSYEKIDRWMERVMDKGAVFVADTADGQRNIFIQSNLEGFQAALVLLSVRLRLDTRSQMVQLGLSDNSWVELNDYRESALRCVIEDRFNFPKYVRGNLNALPASFKDITWKRVKEAHLAINTIDPFLEWLGRLPVWDGIERLDDWMHQSGLRFHDDTDGPLLEWASKSILLVAVRRAIEPGLKHDVMPVLIGPQGVGKSSSLAWLFPEGMRSRWFSDEIRLNDRSNDRVEAIQGSVIAEVAEMAGATSADIESLKAFLSRTVDYRRLAYRRNPEPFPRMCSLIGTANKSMLPNDPTGNRRFAALSVVSGDAGRVMAWLDENREQLWSEAFARARKKEDLWITSQLQAAQQKANEQARSADLILETAVEQWLASNSGMGKDYFRLVDVAVGSGMIADTTHAGKVPVGEGRRLGRVLQVLGCEHGRRTINGVQLRVWLYPKKMQNYTNDETDHEDLGNV